MKYLLDQTGAYIGTILILTASAHAQHNNYFYNEVMFSERYHKLN